MNIINDLVFGDSEFKKLNGNISTLISFVYSTIRVRDEFIKNELLDEYNEPMNLSDNERLSINKELSFNKKGQLSNTHYYSKGADEDGLSYHYNEDGDLIYITYDYNGFIWLAFAEISVLDSSKYSIGLNKGTRNITKVNAITPAEAGIDEMRTLYYILDNPKEKIKVRLSPKKFISYGHDIINDDYKYGEDIYALEITKYEGPNQENDETENSKRREVIKYDPFHRLVIKETFEYNNLGFVVKKKAYCAELFISETDVDLLISLETRINRYLEIISSRDMSLLYYVNYEYLKFDGKGNWSELLVSRNFIHTDLTYVKFIRNSNTLDNFFDILEMPELLDEELVKKRAEKFEINLEGLTERVIVERIIQYLD